MTYKSVIVGTDGSETAELAVRHAARLAASSDARLVIVTAYEPKGDPLLATAEPAPNDLRWLLTDRSQADEHAARGREVAGEEGARNVVVQASEGIPHEVLIGCAVDFNGDLIVVGSVGITSPARFVLGSVASNVVHHAPCDVLIVHTTD